MNLNELIKLGSIFEEKKNFEIIKRKFNLFEEAFEKLLNLNEGYITQDNIDKTIIPLLIENLFIPDKKEHRIN